jgi:hypothetical protein
LALTALNPSVTPSEWMAVVRRALRPIGQKLIKPVPTGPAQRRRNVSVRQGAHDLHAFARCNQLPRNRLGIPIAMGRVPFQKVGKVGWFVVDTFETSWSDLH